MMKKGRVNNAKELEFSELLQGEQSIDNGSFDYGNEETEAYVIFTSGSTGNPKGIPIKNKSVLKNLETLLQGKAKKIDICTINDTPFVYVACLGDYIDMAYSTPRGLKKRYGKIAYILYGLKQFRNKIHEYDQKIKEMRGKEIYDESPIWKSISKSPVL